MYGLRAYTNYTLNYGSDPKLGSLSMFGLYNDDAGGFQDTTTFGNGHFMRRLLFASLMADGQSWEYRNTPVPVYSQIFSDLSSSTLPLIGGVGMRLEMSLQDPSFYMLCQDADAQAKGYRLQIDSATLICPVRTLSQGLALDLEQKLLDQPVEYPVRRMECKKIEVPASLQSYTLDNLVQSSQNPDR